MIRIDFPPPGTPAWNVWQGACRLEQEGLDRATAEALTAGTARPKAKPEIYAQLKEEVYLHPDGPFRGKCAYCECRIYPSQYGDLDHYRPKGAVKDVATGKPVRIELDGVERNHPGYYWLAYAWQNLLPTCELCNRPSLRRSGGRRVGKHDFFPVEGFRAVRPGDESREVALLLHPALDEPSLHLGLDPTGVLYGKTEKGRTTIELLGLNDRDLPNERRDAYERAELLAQRLLVELERDPSGVEIRTILRRVADLQEGRGPFTLAARLALSRTLGPHRDRLNSVLGL